MTVALALSGPGRIAAIASALALCACGSSQVDAPAAPSSAVSAMTAPAVDPAPAGPQLPPGAPPLAPDLLAIGSQEARDDLYCSAVIYDANPEVSDALAPVDEALLRKAQMMAFVVGESGINRLMEEKAAHATHARAIADAYAVQVEKDARASTLRISADDCMKRAQAVPVPQ
jgi:hypothetical protein